MEVFPHRFYTRSICGPLCLRNMVLGNKGHYIRVGCPRLLYPMSNSEVCRCENACTVDIHTDSNSTTKVIVRTIWKGSRIWERRRICTCTASNSWPLPRFQRSPANVGFVARNSATAVVVAWEQRSLRTQGSSQEARAPPLQKNSKTINTRETNKDVRKKLEESPPKCPKKSFKLMTQKLYVLQ